MIYLDHAATTQLAPEVLDAMLPYMKEQYGNAGSMYALGMASKKAINEAKRDIAGVIGAQMEEICFTSGGTESDNVALLGAAYAYQEKGRHIITTKIEHHAVLRTCAYLEKQGFSVTYLEVDSNGLVKPEQVEAAIRPDTILVSVMFANNEIGTIQPIAAIGAICKKHGICFHTDAVQALGQLPIDVDALSVDLLSASAHKIYGPKGVGLLYIRKGIKLSPIMYGGLQESGRRPGTENVPGIVGFEKALKRMEAGMGERNENLQRLQRNTIERILKEIPDAYINGSMEKRLSGNIHVSFRGIEGESLLVQLDMKDICASSGSACTTGQKEPSHVLLALGLSEELAKGSLRLTLGEENTEAELTETVEALKECVEKLRGIRIR